MSNLPNTVDPTSGKIIITAPPPNHPGFMQNITGGLIDAASSKTSTSIAEQASHAKAFGVNMRGSGRKRRFTMKGGQDAMIPTIPEAHSIPGISHTSVHMNAMNTLNQLKADGAYDNLLNATPYKTGGFRFRGEDQAKMGGQKRTHKGKKHGRPSKRRSHRRHSRRNAHRTRRGHRTLK